MCGIAGFSGYFNADLLGKMGVLIAHRGPDDAGDILLKRQNSSVGLVHKRLSIIDLSVEGRQPMTVNCAACCSTRNLDSKDKLWLTYNGEIYNYRELRVDLEAKGHRFNSQTDSEILLHLYAQEGAAMLKRLNGIFAFALYDGREKGQEADIQSGDLLLARDGVGTKPLYYTQLQAGFLFASELKALLAYAHLPRDIDFAAIHYYLTYLWCPGEQTALQSVKKLQPGEAMTVRNGKVVRRWYFYDLPYGQTPFKQSEKVLCAELDKRLTEAMERQLISDVPVGAFLSGGLDSSAIVAMMRKLMPGEPIQCYSIGFANGMFVDGNPNDLPYAKQVAKHLQVDLKIIEIQADLFQQVERMLYHLDEPQADPAAINTLLIAEAARQDGIKVLLSGAGGDDIFSGYRRHRAIQAERFWAWLPTSIRYKISSLSCYLLDGYGPRYAMKSSFMRRFAKLFAHAHYSIDRRISSHFMWSTEGVRRSLYSADLASHLAQTDTLMPLLDSLRRIPDEQDPLNRLLYLEGKHFLPDHNLNYTDKMSMAVGVEVRVPLLDPDLINFATRIPSRLKQKGKTGKFIFKKAMEPYLPKNIIYRPKAGFGVPLRQWVHRELQPMIHDALSESAIKARNMFDPKAMTRLIKLDKEGRIDGAYTIFSALCIELWCRSFVDCNH